MRSRVSTDKQGESGLGLEAQCEAAKRVARQTPILTEFVEVETAKKSTAKNRPQLLAAIAESKRVGAILFIAKLDRLARNVHFMSGLMESGVDFVAADMPQANRLTVHIGNNAGLQTASGLGADVQIASHIFGLDAGMTPTGFLVTDFTGGFRFRPGNGHLTLMLDREPIGDTLYLPCRRKGSSEWNSVGALSPILHR